MENVLSSFEDYIQQRIVTADCVTHNTLREELMTITNGSSVRSIENLIKGIHKSSRLRTERVKEIIADAKIKVVFLNARALLSRSLATGC